MSRTIVSNKKVVESAILDDSGKIVEMYGEVSGPLGRCLRADESIDAWIMVPYHRIPVDNYILLSTGDGGVVTLNVSGVDEPCTGAVYDPYPDAAQTITTLSVTSPGLGTVQASLTGHLLVRRTTNGVLQFGEVTLSKELRDRYEPKRSKQDLARI